MQYVASFLMPVVKASAHVIDGEPKLHRIDLFLLQSEGGD